MTEVIEEPRKQSSMQAKWDDASDCWVNHVKEDKNRPREVFPTSLLLLGDIKGRSVLDAGCGEGSFCRSMASLGARVFGVDFANVLEVAIEQERAHSQGIKYTRADLGALKTSFPAYSFDSIVCNLVLHCCPDLEIALRAFHQLLKPGGRLVVADLHPKTFPIYSKAWTSCIAVTANEYRYRLGPNCPELSLFVHQEASMEQAFARTGFKLLLRQSPPAHPSEHLPSGLPRFLYYSLQKIDIL